MEWVKLHYKVNIIMHFLMLCKTFIIKNLINWLLE